MTPTEAAGVQGIDGQAFDMVRYFQGCRKDGPVRACVSELAARSVAAMDACVGAETSREQAEARDRLPGLYEACALATAFDETYVRELKEVRGLMVLTFGEWYAQEHEGDIRTQALRRTVGERRRAIPRNGRNHDPLLRTLDRLEAAYEAEFGEDEPTSDGPVSSSSD
ncbi:MAG TPA: hypothetical protein VIF43_00775 [Patescibacteria group bacterium]|jgi:hypothetical protein